jgi:hypothetical protein
VYIWSDIKVNMVEFDHFKMEAGLPTFVLSPKQWAEKIGAVGIISKSGRYGGTYAHRDIAFEFGAAIIQLREMAVYQLEILDKKDALKAMKKLADDIYLEQQKKLD